MDDDELWSSSEERIGTSINGTYQLQRLLGVGGGGAVYEATASNGALVAIKVLHRTISRLPGVRERFHREALIGRRIDDPGVVRIFDDGVSQTGDLYLAMDLLIGQSIEQRAQANGGALPMNEVLAITAAALQTLAAAHRVGIVHRDLKPENLFLTTNRTLKVLDFGIAKVDAPDTRVRRTRTGIIMGTPAFMAPEQAKASWGQVDHRTDIWAMGAIMFTLLSGRPVHAGADVGEVLAAAAMRPAPSLARVVTAPIPLVRVVDRALSFDQRERYPSAAEMREAIVQCVEEIRAAGEALAAPQSAPSAGATALDTLIEREEHRPQTQEEAAGDPFAIVETTEESRAILRGFFELIERALLGVAQYGRGHPETDKRIALAVRHAVSEIDRTGATVAWNVTPYSFTAGGEPLWEPQNPHDRVPYQLFADGLRIVSLLPGIVDGELDAFMRLIMKDRLREMAPEDDFVTLLWEADFQHVAHQAIDNFGDGDLSRRARFENDVQGVFAFGRVDNKGHISTSFAKRGPARPAAAYNTTLMKLLGGGDGIDAAAVVSAEAMLAGRNDKPAPPPRALDLRPDMLRILAARLAADANQVETKFVRSVALAWMEARTSNATDVLAQRLRSAIDSMVVARADLAIRTAAAMCRATGERQPDFGRAIVSIATWKRILAFAKATPQNVDGEDLRVLCAVLDGAYFDPMFEAFLGAEEGPLKELIVGYFARADLGNEARLGALFAAVNDEIGVSIVRMLVKIATPAAKSALLLASNSPHGVVRIEALGHVEGTSSERLRLELKALLEDADASVRMSALRTIEKNFVRVAGPSLVLRIKSPKFDALPMEEKRQALHTLAVLATRRAEEVCIELVGNAGLLPTESREQTRVLAAELLGHIGRSAQAEEVLSAAAGARWRSSEGLRAAAESARVRISQAPPQPPSMQPPSMQPPNMQPPSMRPPNMQPPSMRPPSMQPPRVSGFPPNKDKP